MKNALLLIIALTLYISCNKDNPVVFPIHFVLESTEQLEINLNKVREYSASGFQGSEIVKSNVALPWDLLAEDSEDSLEINALITRYFVPVEVILLSEDSAFVVIDHLYEFTGEENSEHYWAYETDGTFIYFYFDPDYLIYCLSINDNYKSLTNCFFRTVYIEDNTPGGFYSVDFEPNNRCNSDSQVYSKDLGVTMMKETNIFQSEWSHA